MPGSKTKDYINYSTASSINIMFLPVAFAPKSHGSNMEVQKWMLCTQSCFIGQEHWAWTCFIANNKQAFSLSQRETFPHPWSFLATDVTLKNGPRKIGQGLLHSQKEYAGTHRFHADCLSQHPYMLHPVHELSRFTKLWLSAKKHWWPTRKIIRVIRKARAKSLFQPLEP